MIALRVEDAEIAATGTDSLLLSFPLIQPNNGIELLRLDFKTALFSTGAVLRASLQNRASGEGAWQRVDAGNAFELASSNTTTLVGAVGNKQLLRELKVHPAAFSPNGDGINDETIFAFKVVRVGDDSPVEVQVYDLGGRSVRRLAEHRAQSSGAYQIAWDGRDQAGNVVPPGIYYARLKVATQTDGAGIGTSQILKTLSVVY